MMVAALALFSFLLAWKNGTSEGALMPAIGAHCASYESGFALIPLVVGGVLTRVGTVQLSPARFASYTMAFAVFGQLLLRTRCEAHDLSLHLFVFHFLVVLVAGFAGAGAARLFAARART